MEDLSALSETVSKKAQILEKQLSKERRKSPFEVIRDAIKNMYICDFIIIIS